MRNFSNVSEMVYLTKCWKSQDVSKFPVLPILANGFTYIGSKILHLSDEHLLCNFQCFSLQALAIFPVNNVVIFSYFPKTAKVVDTEFATK